MKNEMCATLSESNALTHFDRLTVINTENFAIVRFDDGDLSERLKVEDANISISIADGQSQTVRIHFHATAADFRHDLRSI